MASMGVDPPTAFSLAACELEAPHPLGLVLQQARTLGDALARFQRYHHTCTPGTLAMQVAAGECAISFAWPKAHEAAPALLLDAALAAMAEVGRRGVGAAFASARVGLCRPAAPGHCHVAYFRYPGIVPSVRRYRCGRRARFGSGTSQRERDASARVASKQAADGVFGARRLLPRSILRSAAWLRTRPGLPARVGWFRHAWHDWHRGCAPQPRLGTPPLS